MRRAARLLSLSKGGPQVHALAVYFKTLQAISYERLERMFKDVFGLEISQGALTNMLARTGEAFKARKAEAVAALRKARCVASDETGMRIEGVNGFQWVFSCAEAVVHEAAMTRGAAVAREMMGGHRPEVWLSDGYGGQRGHGEHHQTCLAHLAREVAFGCEAGADHVPALFKLWFGKVFDLARAAASMARPAREARRRALDAELGRLAAMATACPVAAALQTKIARARDRMLTFCAYPGEVEATNNASERHLRPSVVQRKVTNGFRAKWAADHDAAVRTTVDTARLKGAGPFQTICATIG